MHIEYLSEKMKFGTGYSDVLMNNNTVVARANFKDISSSTTTVGYRVAETIYRKDLLVIFWCNY